MKTANIGSMKSFELENYSRGGGYDGGRGGGGYGGGRGDDRRGGGGGGGGGPQGPEDWSKPTARWRT